MLPVSRDTLLRVLRRRAPAVAGSVRVIGIDDFKWKRGQCYGTVVCDLEQRCIVDLLPDQEPATVAAWLCMRLGAASFGATLDNLHTDETVHPALRWLQWTS